MSTFYHGDCLFVMRHDIPPESVDLIYLDPPFFTGKVQKGKWEPGAMEVSFDDSKQFWTEKQDVMLLKAPGWLVDLASERPDFASYLWYMMERLQECHKVLKLTGSIYLHCDPRASHYLKMVMDKVFDERNFQNEIVWHYDYGARGKRAFGSKHDTIFAYHKSGEWSFNTNQVLVPFQSGMTEWRYTKGGQKGKEMPKGKVMSDVWNDIKVNTMSKEHTGYPTQKPEALLERIIKASSNEGDLVLDPFCGCGTTMVVASKLNRRYIGIDIDTSPRGKGRVPIAFQVVFDRGHSLFDQVTYVSRDLSEVQEMDSHMFEVWVNEFYGATKPAKDVGVDGITKDGVPIQTKTFRAGYDVLSQFLTDAKLHPLVPKPVTRIRAVSSVGFDNSARKRKYEIEKTERIKVELVTPAEMLALPDSVKEE